MRLTVMNAPRAAVPILLVALAASATVSGQTDTTTACAEPVTGGELVNTGMRTCFYSNCDAIVGDTLLFGCFPEGAPARPSLCSHDLRNRTTEVAASGWPAFVDGWTTLEVSEEHTGEDLNGDGDLADVHLLYRREPRGAWVPTGFEHPAPASGSWPFFVEPHVSDGLLAFAAPELLMKQDLNDDGDQYDPVIQLYVIGFQGTFNTGVEGTIRQVAGRTILVATREKESWEPGGTDLNGDGDTNDTVLRLLTVEPPASLPSTVVGRGRPNPVSQADLDLLNTATALTYTPVVAGSTVYWGVSERAQGRDLNGDGALDDDVLHALDLRTGLVENSGIAGFPVAATAEPQRVALLGRRDATGAPLRTWDPVTGELESHGIFLWPEDAEGPRVLLQGPLDRETFEYRNSVFDVETKELWFAGFTDHPSAARLSGDRVVLHRDSGGADCYGEFLPAGVEFVDYRRGVWKTTDVAAAFYTRPILRGPVLAFNSSEYLADRDWDGDGEITWPTAVEVYYVLSADDWPAPDNLQLTDRAP